MYTQLHKLVEGVIQINFCGPNGCKPYQMTIENILFGTTLLKCHLVATFEGLDEISIHVTTDQIVELR